MVAQVQTNRPPDVWLSIVYSQWPIAFWIVTIAAILCIVAYGVLESPTERVPRARRFLAVLAIFSTLWLVLIQALFWSYAHIYS